MVLLALIIEVWKWHYLYMYGENLLKVLILDIYMWNCTTVFDVKVTQNVVYVYGHFKIKHPETSSFCALGSNIQYANTSLVPLAGQMALGLPFQCRIVCTGIKQSNCMKWTFHPFLPSGLFHPYILEESISTFRGVWCTFSFLFYFKRNSCKQTV